VKNSERTQFDLVLCDLAMPGMMDGQLARLSRNSANNRTAQPPFILLTAWTDQTKEKEKISESGVDAVVQKPVDMMQLLDVIQSVMEPRSLSRNRLP